METVSSLLIHLIHRLADGTLQSDNADGIQLISKYLRNSTNPSTIELIQEFSPFVFQHSVDEAYKIFTLSEISTESIYQFILQLFDSLPDEKRSIYRTKYIKYLIMMTHLEDPSLNTEYLHILLTELEQLAQDTNSSFDSVKIDDIPAAIKDKRMEFFTQLKTNRYYNIETILSEISNQPLYFERVTLLLRLGRYKEALQIVVNELRSISYACECCVKYSKGEKQEEDPWKILLTILFTEEDEE